MLAAHLRSSTGFWDSFLARWPSCKLTVFFPGAFTLWMLSSVLGWVSCTCLPDGEACCRKTARLSPLQEEGETLRGAEYPWAQRASRLNPCWHMGSQLLNKLEVGAPGWWCGLDCCGSRLQKSAVPSFAECLELYSESTAPPRSSTASVFTWTAPLVSVGLAGMRSLRPWTSHTKPNDPLPNSLSCLEVFFWHAQIKALKKQIAPDFHI